MAPNGGLVSNSGCMAITVVLSAASTSAFSAEPKLAGSNPQNIPPVNLGATPTDPKPVGTVKYQFLVGGATINATYNIKDGTWSGEDVPAKGWKASTAGSTLTYSTLSGETVVITGTPKVTAGPLSQDTSTAGGRKQCRATSPKMA
jgi:hypothetical protein